MGDCREQLQQTQYPQLLALDHIGDGRVCFLLVTRSIRHGAKIRVPVLDGLSVSFDNNGGVHPEQRH